ncbi:MAG: GNAT family N-acetyltransferase [Geodermatophilaceae bacterium]|nr:GNAT family N-acetyltransferase [Geodermatophilaceae bacterium]
MGIDAGLTLWCGPVRLRPWQPGDVPAVAAAFADPLVQLWNAGRADPAQWVTARADWSGGDHVSLAVERAGDFAGSVSLHRIDLDQADAEIGYWTAPAARGLGVATRAVVALCAWAFATLPVDRIELAHAVENPVSGRVAARAGFTREGRLRRSHRYGDGCKHDELLWSRLSDDPPVDC